MTKARLRNGTRILLRPNGSVIQLPSGAMIRSRPRGEGDQAETAQRLGYEADVDSLCRDHDALHALLCDWLGLDTSYSLSAAAGQRTDAELAEHEEAAVIAVQTFMRRAGVGPPWPPTSTGVAGGSSPELDVIRAD